MRHRRELGRVVAELLHVSRADQHRQSVVARVGAQPEEEVEPAGIADAPKVEDEEVGPGRSQRVTGVGVVERDLDATIALGLEELQHQLAERGIVVEDDHARTTSAQ